MSSARSFPAAVEISSLPSDITDGKPHDLAAILQPDRVRLFVDGKLALDMPAKPLTGTAKQGRFAIAQLVGGTLGCDGVIETVRLTRGVREPGDVAALAPDERSIGFWKFDPPPPAIEPAAFHFVAVPLRPEQWPHRTAAVNRDRVYDFYEKQARYFMTQEPRPELLPEYPGIDGGKYGHWGNQNDEVWRDGRWNDTDLGSLMCGVFHGAGLVIPKGVCVRLGGKDDISACFDPATLGFAPVWKGGFIQFSPARHGFMSGVIMKGELLTKEMTRGTAAALYVSRILPSRSGRDFRVTSAAEGSISRRPHWIVRGVSQSRPRRPISTACVPPCRAGRRNGPNGSKPRVPPETRSPTRWTR